ncbi:hypothetical protein SAMN05216251_104284 [Actinacidiphila alni]|uniref:Integral membrane protein n=2 Tax=Actinacidiphila alni TaxID=380248 RepID=A0A1I2CDB4_9ACTN|nr:hypothetical protein SAMN05216251_104284 [Actinacidiphila alni]
MADGTRVSTTKGGDGMTDDAGSGHTPDDAEAQAPKVRIGQGPGRLLLSLYAVFTVAALSRSIVQIATKYHDAPLAYVLSGVAGVVYAVITVALWKGGEQARRVALVCCSAELAGVIAVGTLTLVDSSAFPDATVWSDFGVGYVFLPLALPVAGLLWLRRAARGAGQRREQQTGSEA